MVVEKMNQARRRFDEMAIHLRPRVERQLVRGVLLAISLLLVAAGSAIAADGPSDLPEPTPRARWSEDWSVLRDAAPLSGESPGGVHRFVQPIKYIPLSQSGDFYLSLGGAYRIAYELYEEADMGISNVGFQDVLQHRLSAFVDLHLTQYFRVFAYLGYAASSHREGGAKAVDETNPNFWQLFIDFRVPLEDKGRVVVRGGRQFIETANVFITAGEANNVRLVYDGGRIGWIAEDGFEPFEAFGAEYVDYADGAFDMSGNGEHFWGLRVGIRPERIQSSVHLLYLGWDLLDRQFEQGGAGRHDELRHTLMLWFNRPLIGDRQWGWDYYLAYQFGEYDDPGNSAIRAFAAFGEFRYALFPRDDTPILGLKTSYFSGDRDPDDGQLNTFYDPVFGTPYFSYARDIMPFNLIHVQPNLGYRLGDTVLVTLSHDFLWRASRDDGYYNDANSLLVRADVSDSLWLGQQTQIALQYRPIPQIVVRAYWSHFFAGDVIRDAGGRDRDYFHIGINFFL
jgi:hypothetical protein